MSKKTVEICALILCLAAEPAVTHALTPSEALGKAIFFDKNLSFNGDQACAACHMPNTGWTGPDSGINATGAVYEGSISGRFGNRKPPSSAYATFSPVLHYVIENNEALFLGGNFWNGRATGERLGNPAADQALGPFLNPVEQALSSPADVVSRVCNGTYAGLFLQVWGPDACAPDKVDAAYRYIARSVAAFEASPESNAFTSKYDYFLKGKARLTLREKIGLKLFKGKAKCANCHILDPGPDGQPPLFTDFTYDNIGVPRNPDNPFYTQPEFNPEGAAWVDLGLGEFLSSRTDYQQFAWENRGKQKVPTLRNVDKRPYREFAKAYAHNGYFKTLKGIVHFYNTRDVKPACSDPFTREADALAQNCWPEPEVPENVNTAEMGNLHLTNAQENAIVAFLKTLSDGYKP
ncbi:cytochrome c, 2 heme-binding sites [Methylocaldum marinum]|uniref:Cytochrome c, 2 heme-binding sites n=1 Tax=Methylocaldum marinum TaxID=1432792 RepID=A0A250KQU4_9GAMM|nr:cytochrome c peroxidase [Methylocaldum marinum]BBA33912.1 cytochrome c, 2 heme-binding sites [Methylocaldum marinum]